MSRPIDLRHPILCLVLTMSFALLGVLPARAAEAVSDSDAKALRGVVEAQLAAFAADDAERAFSYAAPPIRDLFKTPDRFLDMVRNRYPVVYRPSRVVFLAPVIVDGQFVQAVQMTDASGALWLAVYQFDRQADRTWRISGCVVQPSAGRLT